MADITIVDLNVCKWWLVGTIYPKTGLLNGLDVSSVCLFFFSTPKSGMILRSHVLTRICFDCSTMPELVGKSTGDLRTHPFIRSIDTARMKINEKNWWLLKPVDGAVGKGWPRDASSCTPLGNAT